jgi:flagellar L-ring protein precursor FlgH
MGNAMRSGAAAGDGLFLVVEPEPREYDKHDLVQIVVVESSRAKRSHELDTEKDYNITGEIAAFPHLTLSDILQLQLRDSSETDLPRLDIELGKDFEGDGEYERKDDLTARLTAEVIEILPNGNLILEARTEIKTDEEESVMKVTGTCRPEDITAANTVLSNQVHDLKIEKVHSGELKKTNEKGIIAKVFDFLFAW